MDEPKKPSEKLEPIINNKLAFLRKVTNKAWAVIAGVVLLTTGSVLAIRATTHTPKQPIKNVAVDCSKNNKPIVGINCIDNSASGSQSDQKQDIGYWQNSAAIQKLPDCENKAYLSSPPTNPDFVDIIPLGALNPTQGHIHPTDHIYLNLKLAYNAESAPSLPVNVLAPGAVHVIGARTTDYYKDGKFVSSDYVFAFMPCRQLTFYFAHVPILSGGLKETVDKADKKCTTSQIEGDKEFKPCTLHFDYTAKAGEQLGVTGGANLPAFDWGSFDGRTPKLPYANQDRNNESPEVVYHTACPLDYYGEPLKSRFYAKLPVRPEPRCGTPMQDVPGTAQGNWHETNGKDWAQQLAIVHDNVHPEQGVVSVGGTITTAGTWYFAPSHQGLVNREPSEVKPDGQIYCYYQTLGDTMSGQILVKLTDASTLLVEYHTGGCSGNWALSNPKTYNR